MLNTRQLGGTHLSHEIFFWQGKESTQVRDAYSAPPKTLHCTSFHLQHEAGLGASMADTVPEHCRDMTSAVLKTGTWACIIH